MRQLGVFDVNQSVVLPGVVIAKPPESANVLGSLREVMLDGYPKFEPLAYAVNPPRSSLTMVFDDHGPQGRGDDSGRVETKSRWFGAPGNRGSALFR